MERLYKQKSRKGKRFIVAAAIMLACVIDVVPRDAVAEMSLDEALDAAYSEYICEVAPEAVRPFAAMSIRGDCGYSAEVLSAFVQRHNPDFDPEIAQCFVTIGDKYGIRGDVALCQAIVETGWFLYKGGTAVDAGCHNYCGLGVTSKGKRGAGFKTVEEGVTAHIQHLYAYCTTDELPDGEKRIDPRFAMVNRGCAQRWHDLNGRWAMNNRYSTAILSVYASLAEFADNKR